MGRPLKRWPPYALGALEDSLAKLKELEALAGAANDAIVLDDTESALRDLGAVRALALKCVINLVQSRAGTYEKEEGASSWLKPEEKSTRAIAQVVATRRQ